MISRWNTAGIALVRCSSGDQYSLPQHLLQTASPFNPMRHPYPLLYAKNFRLK
jgi:hypothetical protein